MKFRTLLMIIAAGTVAGVSQFGGLNFELNKIVTNVTDCYTIDCSESYVPDDASRNTTYSSNINKRV